MTETRLKVKYAFFLIAGMVLLSKSCVQKNNPADTLFRQLSARQSGISFENQLNETEDFNIIQYLYFYNGGGLAIGDINNDSLPDVYFTANQLPNKLYLNKGNLQFEDITERAGVAGKGSWKTGVTMADVNGDGWLDIYVCQVGKYKGLEGRNELYLNKQDGTFEESAAAYGLDFQGFSTQAAFFDYDRDGDLDLYLLNHSVHETDNFGKAHLRLKADEWTGDRLFRNDGARFADVTAAAGIYSSKIGYGLGIAIGDLNNDGWADIYVSNDFHENDYLYYNNADGTFTEAGVHSFGHTSNFSMGSDVADFNNDGWMDILTLDMKPESEELLKSSVGADPYNIYRFKLAYGYHYQFPRNMLQLNRGKIFADKQPIAAFSEIGQLAGVDATDWSWAALFCDLDNDGWKDIFISNGIWRRPNDLDYLKFISNQQVQKQATDLELASKMPAGLMPNYTFRNTKSLVFENVSKQWGLDWVGCSNGAAYADLDNDGDLDLVTNNLNAAATVFENRANEKLRNNFLKIKLIDTSSKNTFGIGARVTVETDHLQVQELYPSRGFQSACEPLLTFGLQKASQAKIRIYWADGTVQDTTSNANQALVIIKSGIINPQEASQPKQGKVVAVANAVNFLHRENDYNDFDREKLQPHQLSNQGPKLATGDVNADGLPDFYVCGAAGQAGGLFLQTKAGKFTLHSSPDLVKDSLYEDTDASFFDADADGDLDLYVVSGGGVAGLLPEQYYDRLYFNDGKGVFQKKQQHIPEIPANGACVVAADFNQDGAPDLFVGSRSVPGSYGLSPSSFIFINNGKGVFSKLDDPILNNFGMVTSAIWLEKAQMLAVVGEWMPLTFLKWNDGKLVKSEVAQSNGWWNTLHPADLDGDGDQDLLLGNLGLNTNLKATEKEPLELFIGDFDNNLFTDPILAYYKQGKQYSYFSKDELFSQLVTIRKKFLDYQSFSKSTFQSVFEASQLQKSIHKKAYTLASCWAENRSGGQFVLHTLPLEAQLAPIFAFATTDIDQNGMQDIFAVGNWYDVQPSMGRYDASLGLLLLNQGEGRFHSIEPGESGFVATGEGRDLQILQDGVLLFARNNLPIQVFHILESRLQSQ